MVMVDFDGKTKVSIVIPVYNAKPYLKKCLDSVINQTLKEIEIIIIDDESTDGSSEICKSYLSDSRVSYFYKKNEGLAAARQDGMERAHGDFIGFVDSDDWIEPNMYERMYEVAVHEKADVVMCGIFIDENGKNPEYLAHGVYDRERIEKEILPRSLAGLTPKGANSVIRWCNWSRLYSMKLIKDNNIAFDRRFRRSQDLQITFETALVAEKYVSICNEYLYHNRTDNNGTSLSRGYTKNFWHLYLPLIERLYVDVKTYTKQDLTYSMHLCTFFFAEAVVWNEYKAKQLSKKEKIEKLDELAKASIIKNALKYVPSEKLNSEFRAVYNALSCNTGKEVYNSLKKHEFNRDIKMPIIRAILNNKIVDPIYRKVRHKG